MTRIPAAHWHAAVQSEIGVLRDLVAKERETETRERGHDCGHLFTITSYSQGHYSVTGDPEHHDAPDADPDLAYTLAVRAHCLRDALIRAALTPLTEWAGPFDDTEETL